VEVTLTEDQEFFRDTTRKFLEVECPIATVRSFRRSEAGFDRGYWTQGAALGWTSLLVTEELGGGSISGQGLVDLTLVAEEFGRHASPGPLVPANVVAAALARSGSDEHRRELIPAIMAGELVPAWVVGPPDGAATRGSVVASAHDGEFVLSGAEAVVEAAAQADLLLVTAVLGHGVAQFLVSPDQGGVHIIPLESLDLTKRYARVELDGVRVSDSAAVGAHGHCIDDVEHQRRVALVIQISESVGAARAVLAITLEWAFDRYSFGRPLASYQEIKHRFADMKLWLDTSDALATAAARSVQADDADAAETVSVAAAYTGQYLPELIQDCQQLHGGLGVTYELDLHLYLRRVTVNRSMHGTPAQHRQRIVALQEGEA
jgi:alkylation response protein AidB-like acyl-CoA dehydrogenase